MKGIVYMCIDESTVLGFETADLYTPIPSRFHICNTNLQVPILHLNCQVDGDSVSILL